MKQRLLLVVFWLGLLTYFAWDWYVSEPINIFDEPPLIAIGSGQAPTGGHCSNF